MLDEVRPQLPGAAGGHRARHTTGCRCSPRAHDVVGPRAGRARGGPAVRRPDQHPVHVRHDGLPQGRDALASQHPEQRLSSSASCSATRSTIASAFPVPFYHCFGMVLGNLGCTTHGACMVVPARRSTRSRPCEAVAAERCTSLYGVPTMFIAQLEHPRFDEFDLSSLRTGIMAGSPCPVEVMKQVQSTDAHAGGHHRLRHDRDVARLDADAPDDPLEQRVVDGRPRPSRTWRSRSSTPNRAPSCRAARPASSARAATA